jgi:uncharacterized protein YigE (DUF2233 family)
MQLLMLLWTLLSNIVSYNVDPALIRLYWKDDNGQPLGSLQHLKDYVEHQHKQLLFAMNGGMFKPNGIPVGLLFRTR